MTPCCASAAAEDITHYHHRFLFGSVADHLAETFGTKGSPISLSTACASGASAIQLGVEAIRRGEADAALCVATDGSVNPEALVRFSLLSALSTHNDPPQAAVAAVCEEPRWFRHGGRRRRAGAGKLGVGHRARRKNPRHRRRLRRTGGLLPPHPLQSRRQADHRLRAQCAVGRRPRSRPDRLHQRPWHRHAGKRQDGISGHLDGVRRARPSRFRSPPTSRWSAIPFRRRARSRRYSRC